MKEILIKLRRRYLTEFDKPELELEFLFCFGVEFVRMDMKLLCENFQMYNRLLDEIRTARQTVVLNANAGQGTSLFS